jgi:hypothetical protein
MLERARRKILITTLALLGIAAADGPMVRIAAGQGTPQQQAACQNDAFRLCGQFIPDVANITACMVKQIRSLSPGCRAEFVKNRKKSPTTGQTVNSTIDRHRPM